MFPLAAYRRLYSSLKEHHRVEKEIQQLLDQLLEPEYIRASGLPRHNPLTYAQRHFFSILFLSIYEAIGIPAERRLLYGMVNHCLRGIVTGADNLLDDEYKELLPLNFPEPATRFKSVMHILIFDRMLFRIHERFRSLPLLSLNSTNLDGALFKAIVPIGAEEAREEGGVKEIITPEAVLDTVHMYKGGKLLCLSFVAPRLLEPPEFQDRLACADQGIFHIGVALQLIDDLTDFYEDIRADNHNYLVSAIFHQGTTEERRQLRIILDTATEHPPVEAIFPATIRQVMLKAVSEALRGFAMLHEAGYWLNQQQAYDLVRHLFVLRGVKQLLPFFPTAATAGHHEP
ncbi:MAG: hypothetical protein A2512_06315 [Deltaproteobacteria bacterium RIFOXYD12_FULL_56_24]|nr:MAG: hypothetical protein A2512_06315 [Deltaproteobacteria bacterium RIFOXYD12_FULL_56_24]